MMASNRNRFALAHVLALLTAVVFLLEASVQSCFVTDDVCPNVNVTFWLYRNETHDQPIQLDPLNLSPCDFQPPRPLKILIHGYTGDRDFSPNSHIRPILLQHDDVYVISPDYGPLAREPCYLQAVENLPKASRCLAQLINNLVNEGIVANEDIHVIGFSLGAQVAGQLSNYVDQKLTWITGLDPAKPLFITVGPEKKLDPNDADFVDVLHTDGLARGMLRAMGHVDFYANSGLYQPGCLHEMPRDPSSCNHDRAPQYYAESIYSPLGFWGYPCPSWLNLHLGLCSRTDNDILMGYYVNQSITGSYFFETASSPPFALGPEDQSLSQQPSVIYDGTIGPELQAALNDLSQHEAFETLVTEMDHV